MADEAEARPVDNPAHVEDLSAPIVYADVCLGGGPSNGGNLTLTFATGILDHRFNPPPTVGKTVLRLVMPMEQMRATADFINRLLSDLESDIATPAKNSKLN